MSATTNLISCHEHTSSGKLDALVRKLKEGESGAYISDAGTPGISDPGAELVRRARASDITVVPIPGASALTALLSVAGVDSDRIVFHGFFPRNAGERKEFLAKAKSEGGTHVFFESPQRLTDCLETIADILPDSNLLLGRELTKKFEEITQGTPADVVKKYRGRVVKGECAIALSLPAPELAAEVRITSQDARALIAEIAALGASQKIVLAVGKRLGLSRKEAYSLGISESGTE